MFPVFRPRFEPGTSKIFRNNITYPTVTLILLLKHNVCYRISNYYKDCLIYITVCTHLSLNVTIQNRDLKYYAILFRFIFSSRASFVARYMAPSDTQFRVFSPLSNTIFVILQSPLVDIRHFRNSVQI
jgi:hypothetical protein